MNEKKGIYVSVKDIIVLVLVVFLVFYFAFEIFKIKHQMNFAGMVNQMNQNTVWIQNFSKSIQQAQAQQRAVQPQVPQPEKPKKEGK